MIGWERRAGPVRFLVRLGALWHKMSARFEDASLAELEDALRPVLRRIGRDTVDLAKENLLRVTAGGFTRQIYNSLGYKIAPGFGEVTSERKLWIVVGLYRKARLFPPTVGNPPSRYLFTLEYGSAPHRRPWGRLSRMRIASWMAARGIPIRHHRAILASIAMRGTPPQPFMQPTIAEMEARLDEYVAVAARAYERGWDELWR